MTDGTLVNSSNAEWLKSSFFQVRVGFDGANPDVHDRMRGRNGAFNSAVQALKLLQGGSAELAIAMALHRETANQIIPIAELATATLNIRPDGTLAPYKWLPLEVGNVRQGVRQVWKGRLANIWNEPRVSEAVRSATSIQAFTTMLNAAAAVLVEEVPMSSAISPVAVPVWKAPPFSREESAETRLVLVTGSPFICNTSTWEILRHIDGKTPVGALLKKAQTAYPAMTMADVESVLTSLAGVITLQEPGVIQDNRK